MERVAPSGAVRQRVDSLPGGTERIQQITVTGRLEKEVLRDPDGTVRATTYDLGRREKKLELARASGGKEITTLQYNRNGELATREIVKLDTNGAAISRSVVAKNNLRFKNSAGLPEFSREYVRSRYGYAYRPVVISPDVYAGWYDPYWFTPAPAAGGFLVSVTSHPFAFSWGWGDEPWFTYYRAYWEPYPFYLNPSYWLVDWLVAGYLADRYATLPSVEQAREEVRLAREDGEKARLVARQASDAAEVAEAKAAATEAELRASRAEVRAAHASADEDRHRQLGGQPGPNAHLLDKELKAALRAQIDKAIAQKKAFAEQSAAGLHPAPPDLSETLTDDTHLYPVSRTLSVISLENAPAGTLSAGDLIKAEPGQQAALRDTTGASFVTVRVVAAKGDPDEVAAGALVRISLRDLQEFDNEFRAKLDLGLLEADKNKAEFKRLAQQL